MSVWVIKLCCWLRSLCVCPENKSSGLSFSDRCLVAVSHSGGRDLPFLAATHAGVLSEVTLCKKACQYFAMKFLCGGLIRCPSHTSHTDGTFLWCDTRKLKVMWVTPHPSEIWNKSCLFKATWCVCRAGIWQGLPGDYLRVLHAVPGHPTDEGPPLKRPFDLLAHTMCHLVETLRKGLLLKISGHGQANLGRHDPSDIMAPAVKGL